MNEQPERAVLWIRLPDGSERSVSIVQSPLNIGRTEDNDVTLPHRLVSRRHARLLFEDRQVVLIDLKSTNGTEVAGTRLTPNEPYSLAYDEVIQIGPYTLWLEPGHQDEPADEHEAEVPAETTTPEDDTTDAPQDEDEPAPIQVGVEALPATPPPPSEPPEPPADERYPPDDEVFGLREERSRYLDYLPPIYEDDAFLGQFLLAFEGVFTPIEQMVDNFDLYLDPHTAPEFFLDQLAAWIGLTLDEKWPSEQRRALLAEAAELYRRRGTRWSLSRHLEIYAGVTPDITEPEDQPHHFYVELRAPRGQHVNRATIDRIIRVNTPAHATYSFEILRK